MNKYIASFPQQLTDALQQGKKMQKLNFPSDIQNIIITGMGGSGIGGAIVKDILSSEIKIPVQINRDYTLPAFANKNTLVICSSYSGETVETLSAMQGAMKKKCNIICISSGGKMKTIADKKNIPFIHIPGGMPPRSCIGYSMLAQLFVLHACGCIQNKFVRNTELSIRLMQQTQKIIQKKAKKLAEKIHQKIPIIYTSTHFQNTAVRWKQQMNENPEVHCFANVLPEMNHNELVAFRDENKSVAIILLHSKTESAEMQKRFRLSKKLMIKKADAVFEIYAEGKSLMEEIFYLIHFGDWVSWYLAEIRNVDAVQITSLNWLKKQLSKK